MKSAIINATFTLVLLVGFIPLSGCNQSSSSKSNNLPELNPGVLDSESEDSDDNDELPAFNASTGVQSICVPGIENYSNSGIDNDCDGEDYEVGDAGPAGGIVFYVGEVDSEPYRLEVALDDAGIAEWGCVGNELTDLDNLGYGAYPPGDTSAIALAAAQTVGNGEANTDAIIDQCNDGSDANTAAEMARAYRSASTAFDDWFLPSIGELNLLYGFNSNPANQSISGFTALVGFFWSSSQANVFSAWAQPFSSVGNSVGNNKSNTYRVRAVRAF